jgi:guanosine-3',5'-bis(diphosphate) 3'-pyrophosphohydrolase
MTQMNKDSNFKIQKIITALKAYDTNFEESVLYKAVDFAKRYHQGQVRESGEPYYYHPLEVAEIIVDMKLDSASVLTAILHDTIEDTDLTLEEIEQQFGSEVAKLVDGVTKLSKIKLGSENLKQAEDFRKLFLALSDDIRVLLVKIADRLHNMRTLHFLTSKEKRERIAQETMQIYAPLTERIGIQQIKIELQDLCFKVLHPKQYESIVDQLKSIGTADKDLIKNIVLELENILKKSKLKATVNGRFKTPYSVDMKMQNKNIGIEQLADIIAFRIIVDSVEECYRVLGLIHANYKMIPDSFQDFISTPKNNDYRSLHTVVIGPFQKRIEIQIRTTEMHEIAEYGLAAHWRYKQKFHDMKDGKQYRFIRELLGILENSNDPEDFLANTKLAMYYDQVFCFTPKGHLVSMPKGATPIDFAYAVHSKLGHKCIGVKVNGKNIPLQSHLKNGDQVEIITGKIQNPSPIWEKFVVTGKARAEIRRFIKSKSKGQYIQLGKKLLESGLLTLGLKDLNSIVNDLCKAFNKKNADDFLFSIGEGVISVKEVFSHIACYNKNISKIQHEAISIKGLIDGIALHFADCCCPMYGDDIIGFMDVGKGMIIHNKNCNDLNNLFPIDSFINLLWDDKSAETRFVASIQFTIFNKLGGLASAANIVAAEGCNIRNFKILKRGVDFFEMLFEIEIYNSQSIDRIIKSFQTNQSIDNVRRV